VLGLALGAAAVALLAGPTAYSIATVGYGQTGSDPAAGPEPVGAAAAANAALNTANPVLVAYLKAHRRGARYLVAASGSQTAAPIALATGDPVITLGGFSASTPAPTVDQLTAFIAGGELRYVIPGPRGFAPTRTSWVESHCRAATVPDDATSSSGSVGAHASGIGGGAATRGRPGVNRVYLCTGRTRAVPAKPRRHAQADGLPTQQPRTHRLTHYEPAGPPTRLPRMHHRPLLG
jgi:hypothetical protein